MQANKQIQVAVTEAVKHNESGTKKWTVLRDLLKAEGVVSTMLKGKDRDKDLVDSLKPSIILGFSVTERKLLAGDVKAMNQLAKDARKVTQQKIGAYIGYIASELAKKEKKEKEAAEGEGEKAEKTEDKPKTVADKLRIVFDTAAKLVQGDEKPEGYDPVVLAKLINQALKAIK